MTDRATLEALLARVLASTGPDRELDGKIAKAFGWIERYEMWWPSEIVKLARKRKHAIYNYKMYSLIQMRPYTGSLDAALTLVPDGWGWHLCMAQGIKWPSPTRVTGSVWSESSDNSKLFYVDAATPARALIAASIKARMEKP